MFFIILSFRTRRSTALPFIRNLQLFVCSDIVTIAIPLRCVRDSFPTWCQNTGSIVDYLRGPYKDFKYVAGASIHKRCMAIPMN